MEIMMKVNVDDEYYDMRLPMKKILFSMQKSRIVVEAPVNPQTYNAGVDPLPQADMNNEMIISANEPGETNIEQAMDEQYGARTGRYDLRPRRRREYSHMHANKGSLTTPQMNIRQGIKMIGEEGMQGVKKELVQLLDRTVISPRQSTDLTPEQRREALACLMFLKRKRCGKVNGRGCADGRKQ